MCGKGLRVFYVVAIVALMRLIPDRRIEESIQQKDTQKGSP